MKRHWLGALLIITWWPLVARAQDWVDFTVTRHVNTAFTAAAFDNALTTVNRAMQLDNHDCSDDVPCTVRFRRIGTVGIFGTAGDGLDIITTSAELNAVLAVVTDRIKVVTQVDYCGGTYNPSIIGCGLCNDFGFVVENWVPGEVYAHEYGHNIILWGCDHRDDCAWNIMNSTWNGSNNAVNATECLEFGGAPYTPLCGDVYDGNGGPLTVAGGPYWVTCDVTVPDGQTLTIEPGVEIQCDPGLQISSQLTGTVTADGSVTRIDIYSNNDDADFPAAIVDGLMLISNGGTLTWR